MRRQRRSVGLSAAVVGAICRTTGSARPASDQMRRPLGWCIHMQIVRAMFEPFGPANSENTMRNLIVAEQISLDGVIQSPGSPEEDPSGEFRFGGWMLPYNDEAIGQDLRHLF